MRVGDTGPRNIIQWVSKAWTDHELKLPVFYRETLARLLALERFRNLIETNISAGAALYTVVTLAGYCVHSTVVPAIVPIFFFAPTEKIV